MKVGNLVKENLVLFGFSKNSTCFLDHLVPHALGIRPLRIQYGDTGTMFFYLSGLDVVETEEAIVFQAGALRSQDGLRLSARQMLEQKLVQPDSIHHLSGNGTVVHINKLASEFLAYQTLMALPQLYYFHDEQNVVCSSNIKCLLPLMEKVEINQAAVPMHFLFRMTVGAVTYFSNVWRLFPGQLLHWQDGKLRVNLVRTFQVLNDVSFNRSSPKAMRWLEQSVQHVVRSYLAEMEKPALQTATLLSGGVDSSLIQAWVKENLELGQSPLSFSFAMQAASHALESAYAKHASEMLGTRHTFFTVMPQDYPDLLNKAIQVLGQPNLHNEGNACYLALAEFLAAEHPDMRCFFAGQGADALFGISEAKKVRLLEMTRHLPGAKLILELVAQTVAPFASSKAHGLHEVATMLAEANDPGSFMSPLNQVALSTQLELARRCFGEEVLKEALQCRLELAEQYLGSQHCLEKIHLIDLLTAAYEPAVIEYHFFAGQRKQLIQLFLDQDIIYAVMRFNPNFRFLDGFTTKPLPKRMLAQRHLAAIASQKKLGSTFNQDLYDWMKQGPLYDMVQAIELPGFVSKADYEKMIQNPGLFLFSLLTFDIFKKQLSMRSYDV